MKTDISQALCIALTSFFLMSSSVVSPVEGKCAGKWAIHACWGGNGKRSDPSMDQGSNPGFLRQLLLRNSPVFSPESESSVDFPAETEYFSSPDDTQSAESGDLSRSFDRLTALLRTLRTLQKQNDALP